MNIIRQSVTNILNLNYIFQNSIRPFAYKSLISLENLYPQTTLKITTPEQPTDNEGKFSGYIPMDQIELSFSRSTGPGGQNVNKVNTKVDLRFHLQSAPWLEDHIKKQMAINLKSKITSEGFLIFRSDITRSQQLNIADCLEKLRCAIRDAYRTKPVQTPETAERLRRRYERAIADRLLIKRQRSQIKQDRKQPTVNEI